MHTYRPLGWTRKGRAIWPVAGGNGTGDGGSSAAGGGAGGGGTGADSGSGSGPGSGSGSGSGSGGGSAGDTSGGEGSGTAGDKGFPENTPVADMTVEQQAAYWRTYARQHEQRNRDLLALADGTPDGLKNRLTELEQLRQSQMTDQERAVQAAREEARTEARTEAMREVGGKMVDAHIKAAVTAGRLDQSQADVVLDGLDRARFLTSDGDVDADKVKTFLDSIAPAKGTGNGFPDLGQGRRDGGSKVSGKEKGLEEARRRFGDRAGAAK